MKTIAALAMAAGLVSLGEHAHAATVLNFDEFAHNGPGVRYISESQFQSGGFSFVSGSGQSPIFGVFARGDVRNADADGATIYHRWSNTPLTISRVDGAAFDLISLDLADLDNAGAAVTNLIQFIAADGSVIGSREFTLDRQAGLQTIMFNQMGVYAAKLYAPTNGWTQFDNLTVGEVASGVPEPATWAVLIVGFFGMGSALRRRRVTAFAPG